MSKEVQILSWCDGLWHGDVDREPAKVERRLSLDGEESLADLCEKCDRALDEFRELINRGAPPKGRKKPGPKVGRTRVPVEDYESDPMRTCKEPDCIDPRTGKQYLAPTRSALGQHVKQRHDKLLADYDWTD